MVKRDLMYLLSQITLVYKLNSTRNFPLHSALQSKSKTNNRLRFDNS